MPTYRSVLLLVLYPLLLPEKGSCNRVGSLCREFHHDAFGVQHFPLLETAMGVNKSHPGLFHIWLKGRLSIEHPDKPQQLELRGFGWFDHAEVASGNWMTQGGTTREWQPKLHIAPGTAYVKNKLPPEGVRYMFHASTPSKDNHPVHVDTEYRVIDISLTLPRPEEHYIMQLESGLRLTDVHTSVFESAVVNKLYTISQQQKRPLFFSGLQAIMTRAVMDYQSLVIWHTCLYHHFELGFDGAFLYGSHHTVKALSRSPLAVGLGKHWQKMYLVEWGRDVGVDLLVSLYTYTGSQMLTQNHMILNLWGVNAWLWLHDPDEFMFFAEPISVQQVFDQEHCMGQMVQLLNVCEAALLPTHMLCASYMAEHEGSPDIVMWANNTWQDVHACYQSFGVGGGSGAKGFVHADKVQNYYIHAGYPIEKYGCIRRSMFDCVFFAHFPNIFRARYGVQNISNVEPRKRGFESFNFNIPRLPRIVHEKEGPCEAHTL